MAIPLPQGNGMDAFNKALGFDNFMKQMLERNKAIEQIAQHKENYGQKENHFLQNLALHKEQLAHARANEGYNRRVAEARLAHYKKLDDPLSAVQDYAALKNWYKSRGQNTGVAGGQQTPMPHEQMGEGMGVYSPEGLQEAQQAPQMPGGGQMGGGNASGLSNEDLELMKQNPEFRGWFKQKYKFDPLAEDKAGSPLGKALADLEHAKARGAPAGKIKQLEDYAQRIAEGNPGVSLNVDPSTGAISFTSGGRGTQGNQQKIVNGQVISKPTTAVSSEQQKLQLAAIAREQALKHVEQPYLGAGASFQMAKDIATYATSSDPAAKAEAADRLVKAAVSEKIVPEIANLQITSQGGKATVHALEKQEQAIRQGWPNFGKKLSDNLPKELQDRVVEEHNKRLKEISDIRKQYFAKGLPIDLKNDKSKKKSSLDYSKMSDKELKAMVGGG